MCVSADGDRDRSGVRRHGLHLLHLHPGDRGAGEGGPVSVGAVRHSEHAHKHAAGEPGLGEEQKQLYLPRLASDTVRLSDDPLTL